jgi:glutamyl-tRNA synthetase
VADGRFAPSPTGPLHLGNLRTALLAWLFARSSGSRFVMRVEDLDRAASRPEVARHQLADLAALGLDWDGPVVHQSDRFDRYREAIADLGRRGLLYPCYCTRREVADAAAAPHGDLPEGAYPGTCRELSSVQRAQQEAAGRRAGLRVRADRASVSFVDRLHGARTDVVDDFVVQRNDGTPAYNLAVVVDDAAQRVAEVVRGDDLLPTTARQVWLAGTLGRRVPTHAHVPLVLAPHGRRLAKRDGSVTLADAARERDEPPAVVCGRLAASLGLAEPGEAVRPAQLVERFDADALPCDPWVLTPADL